MTYYDYYTGNLNPLKGLTWDEIKQKLSDMGKDLIVELGGKGKYHPVRFFSVTVPNEHYDPEGFSEEFDARISAESVEKLKELKALGFSIEGKFFDEWNKNHMKKDPVTTLSNIFIGCAQAKKTEDGTTVRDFNTESVLESLAKIKDVYGEIYDIF